MSQKLTRSYVHIPHRYPNSSGMSMGQAFTAKASKVPEREMYVFCAERQRKTFRNMLEEVSKYFFIFSLIVPQVT